MDALDAVECAGHEGGVKKFVVAEQIVAKVTDGTSIDDLATSFFPEHGVVRSRDLPLAIAATPSRQKYDACVILPPLTENSSFGYGSGEDFVVKYVLYDITIVQEITTISPAKSPLNLGRSLRLHANREEGN
ncbi:hypothetical protein BGW38_000393 [Lunasporangiospora selenospora]|uniref:Uncharacterized protein n=1 Tax=Lunasporangiospora selenospora TaxID=979761 RepID=A0A9P6KF15_9FUNG|nr:hypothetical protein BGW38_000393 [Lunasporangiospora selenospora]